MCTFRIPGTAIEFAHGFISVIRLFISLEDTWRTFVFGIKVLTTLVNSDDDWTIVALAFLLITCARTRDLAFPLIPSTIPFPWDVVKYFHWKGLLNFWTNCCSNFNVYRFLNLDEGPSLQIISLIAASEVDETLSSLKIDSYNTFKNAATVIYPFCEYQSKLGKLCNSYPEGEQQWIV